MVIEPRNEGVTTDLQEHLSICWRCLGWKEGPDQGENGSSFRFIFTLAVFTNAEFMLQAVDDY